MIRGIDTATRLTAAKCKELKAAGIEFVGRYLVPTVDYLEWKALTKAEAEAITGAGLKLLTIWETAASRAKGGAAAGGADGIQALKCARDINMPTNGIIYFAVDFEAQAADMDAIEAYLLAARLRTAEYDIGVYGSYSVVEEMAKRKACSCFWQCVGWSNGQKSPALNVYQSMWSHPFCGISVDDNECADMDAAGIWTYEEDNMTGEQIYNKLNEYLREQPIPDWAQEELDQAVAMGITDGTRPMELVPRYQAAIMAKRATMKAKTKTRNTVKEHKIK